MWAKSKPTAIRYKKLVSNLQGLTHNEARRLARGAIIDGGAIT